MLAAGIDRFAAAAPGQAERRRRDRLGRRACVRDARRRLGGRIRRSDPVRVELRHPGATRQALLSHGHPNIYVLGPSSVIPDSLLSQLSKYGSVKRVGAQDPAVNSIKFAIYRDPPCRPGPCAHVPGSFGWAIPSPGHGYVLLSAARPLDAAAAAPLSSSGSYGPDLVVGAASTLPSSVDAASSSIYAAGLLARGTDRSRSTIMPG